MLKKTVINQAKEIKDLKQELKALSREIQTHTNSVKTELKETKQKAQEHEQLLEILLEKPAKIESKKKCNFQLEVVYGNAK